MGTDIFFYSISIDPEWDTPAVLREYAEKFSAGPGWLFLTASARISRRSRVDRRVHQGTGKMLAQNDPIATVLFAKSDGVRSARPAMASMTLKFDLVTGAMTGPTATFSSPRLAG